MGCVLAQRPPDVTSIGSGDQNDKPAPARSVKAEGEGVR